MVKSRIDDLAVFGGTPAFAEPLHVGRPNLGDREKLKERLDDILDRRWLTNDGPYVRSFEERVAKMLGVQHCIATSNGTTALEIVLRALDLTGEVIVPAFTFVATAHAVAWQHLTPVLCDVCPETGMIEPSQVERLTTGRTSAVVATHLWGRVCQIAGLTEVARRCGLRLIFDASQAFGASWNGRKVGSFGDAEVFSFHATKVVNSFEGGAVTTNDDRLARRVRLMRNFGFEGEDRVVCLGTNGKMTEISGAMGITSLESYDRFYEANRRNHTAYREEIAPIPGVRFLPLDENWEPNYQYVPVMIDERITKISRDRLMRILRAENVRARRYFYPGVHQMQPYRGTASGSKLSLPQTERLSRSLLTLPTGETIEREDIRGITSILRFCVAHGSEISERLATHPAARKDSVHARS